MHIELVRCFATSELQHGRPEQCVKIHNIFANKVHLLRGVAGCQQRFKIDAEFGAVSLERGEIADWGIKPYVKIFAWGVRDFDSKIGRVA